MTLKCTVVVVGDALVGKSALINRLINNEFTEVRPISFSNHTTLLSLRNAKVRQTFENGLIIRFQQYPST